MDMETQHRFENLKDGIDEISKDLNGFANKTNKSVETILENQKQLGEQMTALSGQLTAMSHFMGMHQMGGGHFPMRVQTPRPATSSDVRPMFTGQHTIVDIGYKPFVKPWESPIPLSDFDLGKALRDIETHLAELSSNFLPAIWSQLKSPNNESAYSQLTQYYTDIHMLENHMFGCRLQPSKVFHVKTSQGCGAFLKDPHLKLYKFFFRTNAEYNQHETTQKLLKQVLPVPCSDITLRSTEKFQLNVNDPHSPHLVFALLQVDYYK